VELSFLKTQSLGVTSVGLLPEVGMKFGRWLDLAFLHLKLDERAAPGGG
jgi:phosphinothricin acetyltransferase